MDFTLLEDAVMYSALEQYIPYCEELLENTENKDQFTFIKGDIEIAKALMPKIDKHYASIGGLTPLG